MIKFPLLNLMEKYIMAKKINEDDRQELNELCELSSPKMGRPKVWTDEVIKEFADGLVKYAEEKTSLIVSCYAISCRFDANILNKLAIISPYFRRALITAKRIIGERRETGAILKKLDSKVYGMSQRMYDPEYDAYRLLKLEREELIKAKAKIKALQQELSDQGEIKNYIESQKIIKEVTE